MLYLCTIGIIGKSSQESIIFPEEGFSSFLQLSAGPSMESLRTIREKIIKEAQKK